MPSARAAPGSLHSVAFGEPSPAHPYRNLFELFLVRCFVISFFIWIIWARPFGLGICL